MISTAVGAENAPDWAVQAEDDLKTMVNEVLVIIRDPELTAAPAKQEQILYDKAFDLFDFNTFSMLALGPKYREFSPEQRKDFIRYFSKLISKTYFPKLAGQDLSDLKIKYLKITPFSPKGDRYRTDILTELLRENVDVPIVYRMIRKDKDPWKIYDVKIEGVSMAANYREQFRSQLTATPEEVIAQLKDHLEKTKEKP